MPRLRRAANRVCCRRQRAATSAGGAKPLAALAIVVSLPVLRKGPEVVLFLCGIFASGASGTAMLFGGLLGVAAGAAFTALTYFGLLAIPNRYIFGDELAHRVTCRRNGGAVVGVVTQQCGRGSRARAVWDTFWLLLETSLLGKLLHTLVGYSERPTGMQLMAYIATLFLMFQLMRLARYVPSEHQAPAE